MRVISFFLSSVVALSLSHLSSVTVTVDGQSANACPTPAAYKAVPLLPEFKDAVPTIDPLKNDGMIGNITGGWCESPDIAACPNPLGYQQGNFGPDNNPPFCFSVPGVRNRLVEIMVEATSPSSRVCITDTNANVIDTQNAPLVDSCADGRLRACFAASSTRDELSISIACTDGKGCSTSDTTFWYRVRVSNVDWVTAGQDAANSAIMQPDMWCMMVGQQSNARYPSGLATANEQVPSQTTAKPTTKPGQNSAHTSSSPSVSSILLTVTASLTAFIGMRM